MDENPNSAEAAESAKLINASGIMEGAEETLPEEEHPPVTPEPKPEAKPEPKPEEGEEEGEEEGDEKGEEEPPKGDPPAKKVSRPLKAVFTQIGELRTTLNSILERLDKQAAPSPKEEKATEVVSDKLKALMLEAEEKGSDPEFVKNLMVTAREEIVADLEKKGLLKKDLPPELQQKLGLLDKLEAKEKAQEAATQFNSEWDTLIPELKKQFPNAGDKELAEAKKIMDEIAHSERGGVVVDKKNSVIKGYPLDYILFQNRKTFETLLKVAKTTKSGEGASREIVDVDGDGDIDLDPENMTPAKFKANEAKKLRDSAKEDRAPEMLG